MNSLNPNQVLTLTATDRLAQDRIQHHAIHTTETAFETPNIQSLNNWCIKLWACEINLNQGDSLLSLTQELALWYKFIQCHEQAGKYLQPHLIAIEMQQAWHRAHAYLLDLNHPVFLESPQSSLFQAVSKQFNDWCKKHHYLDPSRVLTRLTERLHPTNQLPKQITFSGFIDFTPQQAALFAKLEHLGVRCELDSTIQHNTQSVVRLPCLDKKDELARLIHYIQQKHTAQPEAKIGIIILDLDARRVEVNRAFKQSFASETSYPVTISGGDCVLSLPMIRIAMQLLAQWNKSHYTYSFVSDLLRSSFITGSKEECFARAQLDVSLREKNHYQLSLAEFHQGSSSCPFLKARLQAVNQFKRTINAKLIALPSVWVKHFQVYLKAWGWPGDHQLSSEQYQILTRWQETLEEWSQCDWLQTMLTFDEAYQQFEQYLSTLIFQPQQATQAIQVLTLIEASGLCFDTLWITGLDEVSWPPRANPTPWIPFSLQRQVQLPHHSTFWEYQQAHKQLLACYQMAPEIIVSYPTQAGDQSLQASSLILTTSLAEQAFPRLQSLADSQLNSETMEIIEDTKGPSILPQEMITGGTKLIKDFADCPFKAFAYNRLHAHNIDTPSIQITPSMHGLCLHRALELIWGELKNQDSLLQLTDEQLFDHVKIHVQTAMTQCQISPKYIGPTWFELAQQRLIQLILTWLQFEKTRPPFTVVKVEHWFHTTLSGLPLRVQVDRIDQLCDGSLMIIDYKTSKTRLDDWFEERLNEPQLPIYYTLNTEQSFSGLAFAQIRPDGICMKGISTFSNDILGLDTWENWEECLNTTRGSDAQQTIRLSWERNLEQLSQDFQAGVASVDPLSPLSCIRCNLQSLCRIHQDETII